MTPMLQRLVKIACLSFALLTPPAQADVPLIGRPAPDFTLSLVNGQEVTLAQLRGQVVVINFWATWCRPCREELPALDTYYREKKPQGLRVFATSTEDSVPQSMMHRLFRVLTIEAVDRITGPYRLLGGVPTNYVIDRAGILRYARAGAFDRDTLNAVLNPLLRERTAPPLLPSDDVAAARPGGAGRS